MLLNLWPVNLSVSKYCSMLTEQISRDSFIIHNFYSTILAVKSQNAIGNILPQAFEYQPVQWVYSHFATSAM